jgi:VWFA-related protein
LVVCLFTAVLVRQGPAQSGTAQSSAAQSAAASQSEPAHRDPDLKQRTASQPGAAPAIAGKIRVDVVVTDDAGKPVDGLNQEDFSLLDNGHSQPILSFSAHHGGASSVEMILLIDTVNTGTGQLDRIREGIEKFLRQNDGHLAHPTSLFWFTDAGVKVQPQPTMDGNALAELVHHVPPGLHTIPQASGLEALLERLQLSVRTLSEIAGNELRKPGRKLLIWTGPGWPLLAREPPVYSARGHQLNFETILSLSSGLRQARMEICGPGAGSKFYVKDFLKGVRTPKEASSGDLALQVLAAQSGGFTLDPGNGSKLVDQIGECAKEAGPFYTLSFDPPKAEQADAYHDLAVQIAKSGMKARTSTGYYDQP